MPYSRGYARYVVGATPVKLTDPPAVGVTLPDGITAALIQNTDGSPANGICWTDDGVTIPSSSEGMVLKGGDGVRYEGDFENFQMVQSGGGAVSIRILYYAVSSAL